MTPEDWRQRLLAFADTCSDRQEALLLEQQGQLATLQAHLEQQVSHAGTDAAPSPQLLQLQKLVGFGTGGAWE